MQNRKEKRWEDSKSFVCYVWMISMIMVCVLFGGCKKKEAIATLSALDTSTMSQFLPVIPEEEEGKEGSTDNLQTSTGSSIALGKPNISSSTSQPYALQITQDSSIPTTFVSPTPVPTITPTPTVLEVNLVAVGDDLLHKKAIESGLLEDGSYNYDHIFEHLSQEISSADLAVINQETIFGTKEMGYSGFPRFCSPTEVGDAIRKSGFDIVLHATNHVVDKGVEGIEHTLNYWGQYPEITVLGIHESQESYANISVIEREGIQIALLNYTYGTNGLALPKDKYYMVNDFNERNMINDIKKAKEIADFIIVFPHWGNEYAHKESKYQRLWANFFAEQGVDLIIGAHPHVLQPIEWITSSTGHKMLVYYSLGNYVSTMDYTDRMLGGMANVTIAKDGENTFIKEASITPIVTHYERIGGNYNLGVYKLTDYTQEMAKKHYILGNYRGKDFSLDKLNELTQQIVGDWIKE